MYYRNIVTYHKSLYKDYRFFLQITESSLWIIEAYVRIIEAYIHMEAYIRIVETRVRLMKTWIGLSEHMCWILLIMYRLMEHKYCILGAYVMDYNYGEL